MLKVNSDTFTYTVNTSKGLELKGNNEGCGIGLGARRYHRQDTTDICHTA